MREQDLAPGQTMGGCPIADLEMDTQGPFALDALDVDVVETIEDAQIAGLSGLVDQLLENFPDRRPTVVRNESGQGKPRQARTDRETLARTIPEEKSGSFQLHEHPMHRLARHPETSREIR
jgi:hypothetical protein